MQTRPPPVANRQFPPSPVVADGLSDDINDHERDCSCERCLDLCPFNRHSQAWHDWVRKGNEVRPAPAPTIPVTGTLLPGGILPGDVEIALARYDALRDAGLVS